MHELMTSLIRRACLLGTLAGMAVALPAAAAHGTPGEPDRTFGDQGVVEQWVESGSSPWHGPRGVWPGGGDRIVVLAQRMLRLTASGAQDASFGTPFVNPVARFPDGRWLVAWFPGENSVGTPVQPMDADGHALTTADAFVRSVKRLVGGPFGGFAALADGTVLYAQADDVTGHVRVTKLALDGTVLHAATFVRRDGIDISGAIVSGSGAIVSTDAGVLRLRNDGSLDPRWRPRSTSLPRLRILKIVPWDGGGVAVLGANLAAHRYELALISHTGRVARRIVLAGATFNDYGGPFASFNYAIAVDARGRLLLARSYGLHSAVTVSRYVGGRVDRAFGENGLAHLRASHSVDAKGMTVMPDGRIVVLGALQRWGTILGHNNASIPGFEDHGAVIWRLTAR